MLLKALEFECLIEIAMSDAAMPPAMYCPFGGCRYHKGGNSGNAFANRDHLCAHLVLSHGMKSSTELNAYFSKIKHYKDYMVVAEGVKTTLNEFPADMIVIERLAEKASFSVCTGERDVKARWVHAGLEQI